MELEGIKYVAIVYAVVMAMFVIWLAMIGVRVTKLRAEFEATEHNDA